MGGVRASAGSRAGARDRRRRDVWSRTRRLTASASSPAERAPACRAERTRSRTRSCSRSKQMTAIVDINTDERYVVAQAGVINDDLRDRGRAARAVVPARPGELPHLDDRRQRRHQRRRHLLREIRSHRRLRARHDRGAGRRLRRAARARAPPKASPGTTSPLSWSARRAPSAS